LCEIFVCLFCLFRFLKMAATDHKEVEIDEGLYSRQLYVMGHEAMKKMMQSNVLVVGLRGLGVEVAKNLILAGVRSVTLHDSEPVSMDDLAAQFYLSEADIGKSRAQVSLPKLAELNGYVSVRVAEEPLHKDFLQKFSVVVVTCMPLDEMLRVNALLREIAAERQASQKSPGVFHSMPMVAADVRGVFSYAFSDFGDNFTIFDNNGEQPREMLIEQITQEQEAMVTLVEDSPLKLDTGDWVRFNGVQGMPELNNMEPMEITKVSNHSFSIKVDTRSFPSPATAGYVSEVKKPKLMHFVPLKDALENPSSLEIDLAKFGRSQQIHIALQALWQFEAEKKRAPVPGDKADADEMVHLAESVAAKADYVESADESVVRALAQCSRGHISPMAAMMGGIVAQEALKACSGKFTPLHQWMHFDAIEMLPEDAADLGVEEFAPRGCRYDSQIAVIGRQLQERVQNLRYFLVGAGAIGCEMIKNWAMMGVATGAQGLVHVTDLDTIEKSNLNRQFLFRERDLGKLKSEAAGEEVRRMNPAMNVKALALRVGPETEGFFNTAFYNSLDGVCNALDNVEARRYMDGQCVLYGKSLLESGTLGTKCNVQVVLPHITQSYSSTTDPPEPSIALCTVHNFPHTIAHTLVWARKSFFDSDLVEPAANFNAYVEQDDFLDTLRGQNTSSQLTALRHVKEVSKLIGTVTQEAAVEWARHKFQDLFVNGIKQLLFMFPKDMVTKSGQPFWTGSKKAPTPLEFDINNELHFSFVEAAAQLYAFSFGIKLTLSHDEIKNVASHTKVPEFVPKQKKIAANDEELKRQQEEEEAGDVTVEDLLASLPPREELKKSPHRMQVIDFEKDDDTNFHMDLITAASNLRATNYEIPLADKHKSKQIAGRIIPAMVTTTALATGLVCLEMLKMIQPEKVAKAKEIAEKDFTLETMPFRDAWINIALPMMQFTEPTKAPRQKLGNWSFTFWDAFEVQGPKTMSQLFEWFKENHNLDIDMVSCGSSLIFTSWMPAKRRADREAMLVEDLVREVGKVEIHKGQRFIILEVTGEIDDTEVEELPSIRYLL